MIKKAIAKDTMVKTNPTHHSVSMMLSNNIVLYHDKALNRTTYRQPTLLQVVAKFPVIFHIIFLYEEKSRPSKPLIDLTI